jgi:hypothetical protein
VYPFLCIVQQLSDAALTAPFLDRLADLPLQIGWYSENISGVPAKNTYSNILQTITA